MNPIPETGTIYPIFPYWFKEGDNYEEVLSNRNLNNIKKVNENWLDPNSTYRVLISQDIKLKDKNTKLSELEPWVPNTILNPNDFQFQYIDSYPFFSGKGYENNYYWEEFKTKGSPCFKTYYDFRQTRCNANSGSGGNGNPVCRAARGKIDVTQGRWYETKKEEIINPKNQNKKIKVSGLQTFW
ncbi:MAG: hypothetical protein SFU98_08540 [Leptospiraceae bacterium]|nr:hypothetical protein [Leptospiraceae bacterium]